MRKKYLSALLFGALLFASAGTFTSCKDYDDEIADLQEQINQKASVEELQKQIDVMKADIEAAKQQAQTAIENAEEAKKKAEEALNNPGGGLSEAEIQAMIDEANATIKEEMDKLAKTTEVDQKIADLEEKLSDKYITEEDLTDLKTQVDDLSKEVEGIVGKVLNSLVYQPSLYVNGIEATEYPWMSYNQLKSSTTADKTFNDNEGVSCTVLTDVKEWNYENDKTAEYNPVIFVDYHVNPSKAEVKKENLSLISGDAEVVNTRASEAAPVIADKDIKFENGILSVPVTAIGSKIKGNHTTEGETANLTEASIFALQANVKTSSGEDRVVTSDYASLYASEVTPMTIAYSVKDYNGYDIEAVDCQIAGANDELFPTVKEAIGHAPTLRVAYDDANGINLKELLEIHYNHQSLTSKDGEHKVWKWGEEAQYGLKYDFALVHYAAGNNKTSDSKYCDQNLITEGKLVPKKVNSDGSTSSEQGISSVGKHPLVRVRVVDEAGKVVLHSYIKVEIVQTVENLVTEVFDKGTVNFGCNDCVKELTWSETSNQLIEVAGVSKEQFEQLYVIDANSNGLVYQFKKVDDKFVKCDLAQDIYGKVIEKRDGQGTTNPVLQWTIGDMGRDQQRIYDLPDHSKTIYVRYVRKSDNPEGTTDVAPIYLPIKVQVAKPEGEVTTKISEYWYNNSLNTRLNVPYPKDGGNSKDFTVDLNQVWDGNKPMFNPTKGFESYTDAIFATQNGYEGGYKYYFTAANYMETSSIVSPIDKEKYDLTDLNGEKYKLFPGMVGSKVAEIYADDMFGKQYLATPENEKDHALSVLSGVYKNNALYATRLSDNKTEMIASIDQNTGLITYNNNSEIAKDLLNAYDSKDAKLFAQIGLTAYSPCGYAMSLKNSSYPAYFLRPISMQDNQTGKFYDAEANGSTINIAEVFDFTDWRGDKFKDGSDYKNVWLYAYYGLQKVDVKIADITTNLNGNDINKDKLSDVTKKIIISQLDGNGDVVNDVTIDLSAYNKEVDGNATTWEAIVKYMGKIKYENNGNNVQGFQIRIPVEFTYDWGVIKSSVTVDVKDTMGN